MIEPIGALISKSWPVARPLSEGDGQRADELVDELRQRYEAAFQRAQIVRIEGPSDIQELIPELIFAMADMREAARRRLEDAKAGRRPNEIEIRWNESVRTLHGRLDELVTKASAVLEESA